MLLFYPVDAGLPGISTEADESVFGHAIRLWDRRAWRHIWLARQSSQEDAQEQAADGEICRSTAQQSNVTVAECFVWMLFMRKYSCIYFFLGYRFETFIFKD